MSQVGRTRFIHFRIADIEGTPVTDRVLTNFAVTFHRDGAPCADPLTLAHQGGGLYLLTYAPTTPGQDYLELYDGVHDLRIGDDDYVEAAESYVAYLTQDTGGVGALKADVARPDTFTLYVFKSAVWQRGVQDPLSAEALTPLDAAGNWRVSPLIVLRDTYHIVLKNAVGVTHVIRPFLDLTHHVQAPPFPLSFGGSGDDVTVDP